MFRFASATVFVFSFATKGLPSEVDWSESCLGRPDLGYGWPTQESLSKLCRRGVRALASLPGAVIRGLAFGYRHEP